MVFSVHTNISSSLVQSSVICFYSDSSSSLSLVWGGGGWFVVVSVQMHLEYSHTERSKHKENPV